MSTKDQNQSTENLSVRPEQETEKIRSMFNRITPTYDFLNHLLSLNIDKRWRRLSVKALGELREKRILDLCCGTGDMTFEILKQSGGKCREVIGLDFAQEMLECMSKKAERNIHREKITYLQADATCPPLEDNSVDHCCVCMGVRNVSDVPKTLSEIHRILVPGGKFAILESALPKSPLMRGFYYFYSRQIIPFVGKLVSGESIAYKYFHQSVEVFPYGEEFAKVIRDAGFAPVQVIPLTLGIVNLYIAQKPSTGEPG